MLIAHAILALLLPFTGALPPADQAEPHAPIRLPQAIWQKDASTDILQASASTQTAACCTKEGAKRTKAP